MRAYFFIAVLSVFTCTNANAYNWCTNPGDGSQANPYQISQPNQLMAIGGSPVLLDKHFVLTNDIVFDPYGNPDHIFDRPLIAPDIDLDTNYFQGDYFTGSFDGNGHSITNLYIDSAGQSDFLGLFGIVSGCTIANINLENVYVNGCIRVGSLAGSTRNSEIDNCHATGCVEGYSRVGGLIGFARTTSLIGSSSVFVSAHQNVGGLVGEATASIIKNSHASGSVEATDCNAGGLLGYNYQCDIYNSYASGDVSGESQLGGLVGLACDCMITRCYASGNVSGYRVLGGLIGSSCSHGDIADCYATGNAEGSCDVGGLIGSNEFRVWRCYAAGTVTGTVNTGSLIGSNWYEEQWCYGIVRGCFWHVDSSRPGIGHDYGLTLHSAGTGDYELKKMETFTDIYYSWDFVGDYNNSNNIWRMCADGVAYPRLSWEFAQNGDFACGNRMADLEALAWNWLTTNNDTPETFDYACDANGDGQIDMRDLAVLAGNR